MTYKQPTSLEEYNILAALNTHVTGMFDEVATHAPCMFCAAPDWAVWSILTTHEDMAGPAHTCKECKRTGAILARYHASGLVMFPVQLAGPDLPSWLAIPRWSGCPAKQLINSRGQQQLYIRIPDLELNQLICTLDFDHEEDHNFVNQDSPEGLQSRSQFPTE